MQRLGKNINGYFGETIDLPQTLRAIDEAATARHWVRDLTPLPSVVAGQPLNFVGYRRVVENPRLRVYLSAGIHGDEPAGPLASLQLLQEDQWPADAAIWFCPCLNPSGFLLNSRENFEHIDLNRDYRHQLSQEVRAHILWLEKQPRFDLSVCMHEDWESQGFYIYEVNPDNRPSLAEKIIDAVEKVCPIECGTKIDDWEAKDGIIRPHVNPAERPNWPEALHLVTYKTRQSYTLEAPSDFPLPIRVAATVEAVRTMLSLLK